MNEIRIVIADDHPLVRGGLRIAIEAAPELVVVAEAEDGSRALDLIKQHQPQVAVLDLAMPGLDGFGIAEALQKLQQPTRVVLLTMHKDEITFRRAIDLGVRGYIVKDDATAEVVKCIKTVASGKEYFSPAISSFLFKRVRSGAFFEKQAGIEDLTPTERRVLCLLAELKTSREIASELGVSTRTIENHRARICSKLSLQGSHALTKFAIQHKEELA